MPKRYRIVQAESFTWRYVDTDERPPKVLARSHETWETRQEVRDAIDEMKGADVEDEDE